jgi:site-specific DNA-methyltransferase (adenine-specific)
VKAPQTVSDILDKTVCGDFLKIAPFLPENFIDLLIVDPPYNLDKAFHGRKFKKMPDELYEEYTESWVQAILPALKENASIYVCCDWLSSPTIWRVLQKYFHIRNRITWQREKGRGALSNWKNGMEDIWFATKSKEYTFNVDAVKIRRKVIAPYKVNGKPKGWEETDKGKFRDTYPSNFWDDISIPYWSMAENTAHPTQKPEKLLAKLILASSNEGDVVFDPFVGSGSTSVTAKKLNRRYVGVEISQQYCIWAEKRLEMAETDPSIQGYTDGIFWERNTTESQRQALKQQKNEKIG